MAKNRSKALTPKKLARCLNEWMRRYTDEPEKFAADYETVKRFMHQKNIDGITPTYGAECTAFLLQIAKDLKLR